MTTRNLSGVYKITHISTNKIYIGSAINLRKRKNAHLYGLRHNTHTNPVLQNFFNKYGENSFIFEPLLYCEKKYLVEYEQWFINNINPFFNVNKNASSRLGTKHSNESKEKMRTSALGRKHSKETIKKISYNSSHITEETRKKLKQRKNFLGHSHTEQAKKKMSEAHMGQFPWNKGIPMMEAVKQKLREFKTGKRDSEETKRRKSESITRWWKERRKLK